MIDCWCGYTVRLGPNAARTLRAHQYTMHGGGKPDKPHTCWCSECACEVTVATEVCNWCGKGLHQADLTGMV